MRVFVPAAAVLVSGLALYFSHSVLDQLRVGDRLVRVALLPGWPAAAAFLAMSALAVAWLARRTRPSAVTSLPVRTRVGALAFPLFALLLIVTPYLPVLPDWFPAMQLLAGPLKWLLWLVVAGLMAWTLWQSRIIRADWLARASITQLTAAIAIATAVVAGVAASRLAGTVIFPAGDEPHYLVMAQSLWRDGDLKIENNHDRRDYREYFDLDLKPDYLTRGVDKEIYSIHPIGLPVVLAPVYAAGGYSGVVIALILSAAIAAAIAWRFTVRATNAAGAATFAWAAIALTTPFLFNTFTVYPEILAALSVILAFTRLVSDDACPHGQARWWVVGLACAALPWLSTKYAPMSATLVAIALARIYSARTLTAALAVVVPYVASLAGWFSYFYSVWGTPLPSAPYGDLVQTSIKNVVFGSPGLLFDQEYGVLAYAPVYVLALTGLVAMWRSGGHMRRQAIEIVLIFGALLGTVGAFRIWWGGTASPGRPVASGLLLLALPIAVASRSASAGTARRAGHQLLLLVSIGVAATLAVAQQGLLINNGRDGTSMLLEYWSQSWNMWALAPTFTFHEAPTAWLHAVTWLAIAVGAAVVLARWPTRTAGGASLAAVTTFLCALLVISLVMPRLPHDPPQPDINLEARWHLDVLDHYDTAARPAAIVYDPLRVEPAAAIIPVAALSVTPGLRPSPQPIRVLHNGRFALPAGQYQVDVEWSAALAHPVALGLQIGRIEPAWKTWTVQPQSGQHWSVDFELPVDVNFVALRGATDVERAIGRITFKPLAVVDQAARPNVPIVLATWQYGTTTAMFHDERSSPEAAGYWVLGGETARATFVRDQYDQQLVLRVHSGHEPNRVRISMRGWSETLTLDPRAPQDIALPDSNRRLVTVDVHPDEGFNPREYTPDSLDRRYLGAWVEIGPARSAAPVAASLPK